MEKIIIMEPETGQVVELLVKQIDDASHHLWMVVIAADRDVLLMLKNGEWIAKPDDKIGHRFAQAIGNEITCMIARAKPKYNLVKKGNSGPKGRGLLNEFTKYNWTL